MSALAASETTSPATGWVQCSFQKPQTSSTSQKATAERPRILKARSAAGAEGRSPGVLLRASMTPAKYFVGAIIGVVPLPSGGRQRKQLEDSCAGRTFLFFAENPAASCRVS